MNALPTPSLAASAADPLSASGIADAVFGLERAIDFAHPDWRDGDIHWWSLYRLEIYRLLFMAQAAPAAKTGKKQVTAAFKSVRQPAEPIPPGAVWLVSDGISYARIGLREIERFCGPLFAACRAIGVPAVVIDRASPGPRDVAEPTCWWTPWTQRAKVTATLAAKLAPDRRHERLSDLVARAARAQGLTVPPLPARRFDAMARAVKRLAAKLERRMRLEQVRAVFVVSYYDVSGYAFVLAAARAGILSVDVQHGVAGRYNPAYARWPLARTGETILLPRCFWTWTESDSTVIADWAPRHGRSARRAVCGGHPFLEAWRVGELFLEGPMQQSLERLLASAGGRTRVLVTLQPNLTHADALAPLTSAFREAADTVWWLRLHPMALAERAAIEALLHRHGVVHWDIDTATALPLPALLPHASVHATHSSSAVLEAEALGIRSIVWSVYGAELAEDAVARGIASVALDGASFRACLEGVALQATADSDLRPNPATQALRTILEMPA